MTKVAINGLGRIGRATLKILLDDPSLKVVGINDLIPAKSLAYLLQYDSVYGRYPKRVRAEGNDLIVGGKHFPIYAEKEPGQLPWSQLEVELVFECTGLFRRRAELEQHLRAGAQRVLLSAPAKSEDVPTVVHRVNQASPQDKLISTASCTTNCIAPVAEVMDRRIGVSKALMTTVHAYTSSQAIVDGYNKSPRRGRAGAANLVPTSTGAALATAKTLPHYSGRFDGLAIRAPLPVGSLADMTYLTKRSTSVEELRDIFREEAESERYREVLGVTSDPLVSADIIGDSRASIVDLELIQVVDGDLVKILSWYDNEWGYASQMVREARRLTQ